MARGRIPRINLMYTTDEQKTSVMKISSKKGKGKKKKAECKTVSSTSIFTISCMRKKIRNQVPKVSCRCAVSLHKHSGCSMHWVSLHSAHILQYPISKIRGRVYKTLKQCERAIARLYDCVVYILTAVTAI